MKPVLIFTLFIAGVIFRLWLVSLVPQPFVFDQTEYHNFALQILNNGLTVWQTRLYGYPLFLAFIYKFFGAGNLTAVFIVQAVIDCLTGFVVYKSAGKIFGKKSIAVTSYILYLINPYTSVFSALVLSEVWAIFLLALIFYLFLLLIIDKKFIFLPALALLLGYFPQVRPAFLIYSFILLAASFYLIFNITDRTNKLKILLVSLVFFCLPFTYNVAGNMVNFGEINISTVDNLMAREFYISLYVPNRSPFFANSPDVFPPEVQKLYNEYSILPKNSRERKEMADKYLKDGIIKVKGDPAGFIFSRMRKFWYVWEKHFLFYYYQPPNKALNFLTYWGNNLILILSILGLFVLFKHKSFDGNRLIILLAVFTFIYISMVHSISLAEERYSLPAYPLVFLFAAAAIEKILFKIKKYGLQK